MGQEMKEAIVATVEVPTEFRKEAVIQEEVSVVELRAREITIASDDDYEKAAEFGQQIKGQAKVVTDFFKPMKDHAYQAHKAVCDREKTMLKPLQEAEKILKANMASYYQEQERKRLQLEAQMRREAEAEKNRKLSEAIALEEEGKLEEAEAAILDAQITESIAVKAVVIMDTPKPKGVSHTKEWEIESIDPELVPVMLAGVEIRPIDEKAIMRLIRASKGSIQISGIRYKETFKIGIRR